MEGLGLLEAGSPVRSTDCGELSTEANSIALYSGKSWPVCLIQKLNLCRISSGKKLSSIFSGERLCILICCHQCDKEGSAPLHLQKFVVSAALNFLALQ